MLEYEGAGALRSSSHSDSRKVHLFHRSRGTPMKMRRQAFCLVVALTAACNFAEATTVKVTPVGQRTGKFCAQDRAILFEDPTGVRLLYDPGNTVAGAADARLDDVHAILISHADIDHLGNAK